MQGFTTDGKYMYWSFTDSLVKTTLQNTVKIQVPALGGHLGDIDYYDGKIYASMMGTALKGQPYGSWSAFYIYVYDAGTLALEKMIRLDPCYGMHANFKENGGFRGIDGVSVHKGKSGEAELWVAGSLEVGADYDKQMIFRFSFDGELLETKHFKTGNTTFGIQNLDYEEDTGYFWFSTYGGSEEFQTNKYLFCVDPESEEIIGAYDACTPYGFHAYGEGKYLVSFQSGKNGDRQGFAYEVTLDEIRRNAIYRHHNIP